MRERETEKEGGRERERERERERAEKERESERDIAICNISAINIMHLEALFISTSLKTPAITP